MVVFLPRHGQERATSEQDGEMVPLRALLGPANPSFCLFLGSLSVKWRIRI